LLLLTAHCFFLPTTHDDEIEHGELGKAPVPLLRSVPLVFRWADTLQTDEDTPLRRLFASVFQTECRRFLRDKSGAYPVFSSMAGKHAAPALRAGRRLDNTTYSANYVSEHQV
jgi:hypothetical protein